MENEIKILRSLSNINIINLDSVYENKDHFFLVFEPLQGGNLKRLIKEGGPLDEFQVSIILKSLLEAVQYLHSKNIMHRDIKPENIFFRSTEIFEKNQVVLTDFGLATSNDVPEYIHQRCGTPGYVAPEIFHTKNNEEHYSLDCDMFSVGITFYYMLTGGLPYRNKAKILEDNKEGNFAFGTAKKYKELSKNG